MVLFCLAGEQTQDLEYSRQALYHGAKLLAQHSFRKYPVYTTQPRAAWRPWLSPVASHGPTAATTSTEASVTRIQGSLGHPISLSLTMAHTIGRGGRLPFCSSSSTNRVSRSDAKDEEERPVKGAEEWVSN